MKKLLLTVLIILSESILFSEDLFKPGDRVAFLGDSITYAGKFIEFLRGFAAMNGDKKETFFFNLGIPGDTCSLASKRVDRELVPLKPSVVFLMFGMNDLEGWRFSQNKKQEKNIHRAKIVFQKNLSGLITSLEKYGFRIVLLTPTPYDEYGTQKGSIWKGFNEEALAEAAKFIRQEAQKRNLPCVDLFQPMTDYLKTHPEKRLCGNDRIHPGDIGHLMIARIIWDHSKTKPVSEKILSACSGRRIPELAPQIASMKKLINDERGLREFAWMEEVAVRNGGDLKNNESADAAFERELEKRKNTRSFKIYQKMILKYQKNRDKIPELKKKFEQQCSELFRNDGSAN